MTSLVAVAGCVTELSLDGAGRVLWPSGEPVFGFLVDERGTPGGQLTSLAFFEPALSPQPTTQIIYGCNLPSKPVSGIVDGFLDANGQLACTIHSKDDPDFLYGSLPGGQVTIYNADSSTHVIAFRWACLSFGASIGSIWRCYSQIRLNGTCGVWSVIVHDYIFDAQNRLLTPPSAPLNIDAGQVRTVKIIHPQSGITQFPCAMQRVNVLDLKADGRAKRSVERVYLCVNRSIVAAFSDGRREVIANAPAHGLKLPRAA